MALTNRADYVQQPVQPLQRPNQTPQPHKQKRRAITKLEKVVYLAFLSAVAFMAILILHKQASIQTASIDIQKLEAEIDQVSKQNVDYKVQVSEKSTFERIMKIAKERGLTLDEKNVKAVPGE